MLGQMSQHDKRRSLGLFGQPDLYTSGVNDCLTFKIDRKKPGADKSEKEELSLVKVELELICVKDVEAG